MMLLRNVAILILMVLLAVSSFQTYQASEKAKEAQKNADEAVKQQKRAESQSDSTAFARMDAISQRDSARDARKEALLQRDSANEARQIAETQRAEAIKQANIAQGNYLAGEAKDAYSSNDPQLALHLFNEAHRLNQSQDILEDLNKIYVRFVYRTIARHTGDVNSVAFSPNGQRILTGSFDKTARLWDLSGNLVQEFSGHSDPVTSVAFSPDGQRILTGSWDNTARLWSIRQPALNATEFIEAGMVLPLSKSKRRSMELSRSQYSITIIHDG